MSVATLAAQLDIHPRTIQRWEAGEIKDPGWVAYALLGVKACQTIPALYKTLCKAPLAITPRSHPHFFKKVKTSTAGMVYVPNDKHPNRIKEEADRLATLKNNT